MRSIKKIAAHAASNIPEGVTPEDVQNSLYDRERSQDLAAGEGNGRVPGVPEVFRRMKRWMEK
jgi:hypothetical protein